MSPVLPAVPPTATKGFNSTSFLDSHRPTTKDRSYEWEPCLILTFGPGTVRYLKGTHLRSSNLAEILSEIRALGAPLVELPADLLLTSTTDPGASQYPSDHQKFRLDCIQIIQHQDDFREQIVLLAALCDEARSAPFDSVAYFIFSSFLELDTLEICEFRKSWVDCSTRELVASYLNSEDHEVINYYVFLKTSFWTERRMAIERNAAHLLAEEAARECRELEAIGAAKLRLSRFQIFVYLMEDSRNGRIKIGKSKSPKVRERTLQSEAPTIVLRFAIPCEDEMEDELHQLHQLRRIRGEWFEFDAKAQFAVVTRLLERGDAQRIVADFDWLGKLLVAAHQPTISGDTE